MENKSASSPFLQEITSTGARALLSTIKITSKFTGANSHYYYGIDSSGRKITIIHDTAPEIWYALEGDRDEQ